MRVRHVSQWLGLALAALWVLTGLARAQTAGYPPPQDGVWIAKDFKFHTGETLPEVKLAYSTIGAPTGIPVLVLHGTSGSARSVMTPAFAGELFAPGGPLDAAKHYIIIPDALGAGRSSKPSDGLKAKFPNYNYDDMIAAQHRLVTEGLGIKRVRLVIGNSMGGMHTWMLGVAYPDFADILVPMASQPTEMSSRNWMLRRLMIETIKADPGYQDGNYTSPPKALAMAAVMYNTATNGGTLALQKQAPTRAAADKLVEDRLKAPFAADANDWLYQWNASRDYNPEPGLAKITAHVLAINSADDERNPQETGIMAAAMQKLKNGKLLVVPGSTDTIGHSSMALAKLYKKELGDILESTPKRSQ